MTLVEILIAATMFAIVSWSLFATARLMYKTAMSNLADGVALHAAEGALEQIRVLPYDSSTIGSPGLKQLAASTSGSPVGISLNYFSTPNATSSVPQLLTQSIASNAATYATFSGAAISGSYSNGKIQQTPLDLQVRILVNERATDVNFGAGITVEVYYRYRVYKKDAYVTRVLRTFVARGVS